jgi:hypothetical protein
MNVINIKDIMRSTFGLMI